MALSLPAAATGAAWPFGAAGFAARFRRSAGPSGPSPPGVSKAPARARFGAGAAAAADGAAGSGLPPPGPVAAVLPPATLPARAVGAFFPFSAAAPLFPLFFALLLL